MKQSGWKLVLAVAFAFGTLHLHAADRVIPGMWATRMSTGTGKPVVTTSCLTVAQAKLMNGDLATLRKYVEESTAHNTRGRCAATNVRIDGNKTIVTITCGKTVVVGTTTYHGDHYESSSTNGTTIAGKRTGGCP
jgi:hypothetical protein